MKPVEPVDTGPGWVGALVRAAGASGEDVGAALELAGAYGGRLPLPGSGATARRWAVLRDLARANLTVARVFEAHTDALAILAEAGQVSDDGGLDQEQTWGVFAAEGAGERLTAEPAAEGFRLAGTKPWCSLGANLDAALVTAHVGDQRQLYRVDLHDASIRSAAPAGWVARGLRTVTSVSLTFAETPARAVGDPQWYLTRPGFAWGGIGVAACWYGGALGLADRLVTTARRRDDQLAALAVGTVDVALHSAAATLADAATLVDSGDATGGAGELLALRVRAVVADAVELTLRQVAHALGPAPLAFDDDHARRVADLELYVRQHHAERDIVALGSALLHRER